MAGYTGNMIECQMQFTTFFILDYWFCITTFFVFEEIASSAKGSRSWAHKKHSNLFRPKGSDHGGRVVANFIFRRSGWEFIPSFFLVVEKVLERMLCFERAEKYGTSAFKNRLEIHWLKTNQ